MRLPTSSRDGLVMITGIPCRVGDGRGNTAPHAIEVEYVAIATFDSLPGLLVQLLKYRRQPIDLHAEVDANIQNFVFHLARRDLHLFSGADCVRELI